MVQTHSFSHTYTDPFHSVSLAYFMRYVSPKLNPFSMHVLSTDTIESRLDPVTGRLHTTRIHHKRSRMPKAIFKLLPASVTGGPSADKASYVLETSVVDAQEGWMRTESRNLNYTGVLSVVEQQLYTVEPRRNTSVKTTVIFLSRLGDRIRGFKDNIDNSGGWLSGIGNWGAKRIQRSIETIASTKTMDQLSKSREGMAVVLERLRQSNIGAILESIRREKLLAKVSAERESV